MLRLMLAALALALRQAASAAAVDLSPAGPWHIDYSRDSCNLMRTFGTGDDAVILRMEWFSPGPQFDLTLTGQSLEDNWPFENVFFRFLPDQRSPTKRKALTGRAVAPDGTSHPELALGTTDLLGHANGDLRMRWPDPSAKQVAATDRLDYWGLARPSAELHLGSMTDPMAAVSACTTDLVKHWGLDPARQASLSRLAQPIGETYDWITPRDYPVKQVNEGRNGIVHARLMIDATGKVTACHVQEVVKQEGYADKTCAALLRSAKFQPALDAKGTPVASYFIYKVRYLMSGPGY